MEVWIRDIVEEVIEHYWGGREMCDKLHDFKIMIICYCKKYSIQDET